MKTKTTLATLALVSLALVGTACSDTEPAITNETAAETTAETTEESTEETEAPTTTETPETTTPRTTAPKPSTTVPRTTTPTTAPAPKKGTRTNPYDLRADAPGGPDMLSSDKFSTLVVLNMRPVDPAAIREANQFNTPAPAGTYYAAVTFVATVDPSVTEPISGYEVGFACSIVGDKGKVYDMEFVTDMDGGLGLLATQPDAIGGGTLSGDVLYLVDGDDTNLMVLCNDDTFIIPG